MSPPSNSLRPPLCDLAVDLDETVNGERALTTWKSNPTWKPIPPHELGELASDGPGLVALDQRHAKRSARMRAFHMHRMKLSRAGPTVEAEHFRFREELGPPLSVVLESHSSPKLPRRQSVKTQAAECLLSRPEQVHPEDLRSGGAQDAPLSGEDDARDSRRRHSARCPHSKQRTFEGVPAFVVAKSRE